MSKIEDFEMMKKARKYLPDDGYSKRELNLAFYMFDKGYHQAEKDLELSWEDMEKVFDLCYEVLRDVYLMKFPDDKEEQKEFYQEVLKRFKDLKK